MIFLINFDSIQMHVYPRTASLSLFQAKLQVSCFVMPCSPMMSLILNGFCYLSESACIGLCRTLSISNLLSSKKLNELSPIKKYTR